MASLTCILATGCATSSNDSLQIPPQQVNNEQDNRSAIQKNLTVATWNTEHLAFPITQGCRPRTEAELAAMQAYVNNLDADIVALQEVASVQGVQQLFPSDEWDIYLSARPDSTPYTCRESGRLSSQQKVAFAVRKGIEVSQVKQHSELGLDMPGLRYGLELNLPAEYGNLAILNVHLKSGCFVDNYARSTSDACQVFAQQAPILDKWVEAKEQHNSPYMIVGDFNHRLSAPYNQLTQELTTNGDKQKASVINITAPMLGCHPYYPAPIDHIFVGKLAMAEYNIHTQINAFENMDPDAMLSDHCAVSMTIASKESL
jgi:endonuclease/exonuclease/phosphatase family metal-dependent hydrolase